MHGTKPSFVPSALPVNLRTRSTGTVHAATAEGTPQCPVKADTATDIVSATVTCRRCLSLQSAKVAVEPQEPPAATPVVPAAEEPVTVRTGSTERGFRIPPPPAEYAFPTIDAASLTNAQFDGVACVRCHRTEEPMVRVGHEENGPLFQCAAHAAPEFSVERCPAWCVADHSNGRDAEHESELVTVAAPEGADDAEVVAQLMQEPGEPLRLSLGVCKGVECLGDADLTIDDAERLVEHLQTLITTARTGGRSR